MNQWYTSLITLTKHCGYMNYKKLFAVVLGSFTLLYAHTVVFAGSYVYEPIVGIPGVEGAENFDSYIDALYALSISIAALIAVIKIVIAGAKYMLSDLISTKADAKNDIKNSLIGLLIIIAAVVILNTINSDLTNLTLFDIEDQILVDSEWQTPLQQTMQEWCDGLAAQGQPCEPITCGSALFLQAEQFLNPSCSIGAGDCAARCVAMGGRFEDDWGEWDEGCYDLDSKSVEANIVASAEAKAQAITTGNNRNSVIGVNCKADDEHGLNVQCQSGETPTWMTEECRVECLEDKQDEGGIPNKYDESSRVCIISVENDPVGLNEAECTYYSDLGWVWGNGLCTKPGEAASGLTFSSSEESLNQIDQTDLNRLTNNVGSTVAKEDIEGVLFLSYDDFSNVTTEDALAVSLSSSCPSGKVNHDLVGSPGGNPTVGFYCLKN